MNDYISIIVPVYNVEPYIEECLESILKQTYKSFEVLLINDGSTDNSEKICLKYTELDNRFKYFYQENKGVSAARNLGITKSKYDWICFVDPDDTLEEFYLQLFVNNLKSESIKTLIITDINRVSNENEISKFLKLDNKELNIQELISCHNFRNIISGYPFNKIYNKKIILDNNISFILGQSYREDQIFLYEYLKYVDKVKLIKDSGYNYFDRQGSAVYRIHNYYVYYNLINAENDFVSYFHLSIDKIDVPQYTNLFVKLIWTLTFENLNKYEKKLILKKYYRNINFNLVHSRTKRYILLKFLYKFKLYDLLIFFTRKLG